MMNFVVLLVLLTTLVAYSESCSCMLQHPQPQFCQADIVMQIRVPQPKRSKRVKGQVDSANTQDNLIDGLRHYNIKINKIYKLKENKFGITSNLTSAKVKTFAYESLCGVTLENNVKYVITGKFDEEGEIFIQLCSSWIMPWAHVTKQMRKNLQFRYQRNCECNVIDSNAARDPQACLWKMYRRDADCYSRFSTCVTDINSTTGGCKWHRNRKLKKCRVEKKNRWMP